MEGPFVKSNISGGKSVKDIDFGEIEAELLEISQKSYKRNYPLKQRINDNPMLFNALKRACELKLSDRQITEYINKKFNLDYSRKAWFEVLRSMGLK